MTKIHNRLDTQQESFDFDTPIEAYARLKEEILKAPQTSVRVESYDEACIELAAVLKATIRSTGKSREEIVDAINAYFGWPTTDRRKCLTLSTFNNYLSKPTQYPIPAVGIIAIQHVCQSLKPISYFAELEHGKVISQSEVRELSIGKLDSALKEIQKMKKELMGGKKT